MRLQVGLYIVYLLDWLSVYSKDQILVLRLEDHAANCKTTMHKVFRFLSLGKTQAISVLDGIQPNHYRKSHIDAIDAI